MSNSDDNKAKLDAHWFRTGQTEYGNKWEHLE